MGEGGLTASLFVRGTRTIPEPLSKARFQVWLHGPQSQKNSLDRAETGGLRPSADGRSSPAPMTGFFSTRKSRPSRKCRKRMEHDGLTHFASNVPPPRASP